MKTRRPVPNMRDWWEDEIFTEMKNEVDYIMEASVKEGTNHLRDTLLIPYIVPAMKKRTTRDALMAFVGKFMDDHNRQLSTSGPVYTFSFAEKEKDELYQIIGITEEIILQATKDMFDIAVEGGTNSFVVVKDGPHRVLLTAILADAFANNREDMIECVEYLFGFAEYPIIYYKYWRQGVKEDVMNYTIEHVSGKFKVAKLGSLQALLKYDVNSCASFWKEALKDPYDVTFITFINRVRTQINSTFQNIANAYYTNHDNDASQHLKAGKHDDGENAEQEGQTSIMSAVIDKSFNKLSNSTLLTDIIKITSSQTGTDVSLVTSSLQQIMTTKENRLYRMVECMITTFFIRNPTATGLSDGFLNYGLGLYKSIGTSKDPMLMEIKAILNDWITNMTKIRTLYEREATIIAYSKAIFNYIVFSINYYK